MDTTVLLVNLVVLASVLESDSFTRKITGFRVARPILVAIVVVPMFATDIAWSGAGATIEVAAVIAGIALGAAACAFLPARWNDVRQCVTTTGSWPYALFWSAVVGLRLYVAHRTENDWRRPFYTWLYQHQITAQAFADSMIFLAFAMTLTRTTYLALQRRRLRTAERPSEDVVHDAVT